MKVGRLEFTFQGMPIKIEDVELEHEDLIKLLEFIGKLADIQTRRLDPSISVPIEAKLD